MYAESVKLLLIKLNLQLCMSSTFFDWNLFNFLLPFVLFNSLFQTVAGVKSDLVVAMCIRNQFKKKTTFHMNVEKPAMYILWRVYCFPTPFDAGIIICPRTNSYFALTYRHRPKGEFQIGFPMQLKLVDMFVNILTAISEFDELTKTHLYLVNLLPGLVLSDS